MPRRRKGNDQREGIPKGISLLRTLEGHTGHVTSVAVMPDGRSAISGSDNGTVRVWDLKSGPVLRKLRGHTGSVCSVRTTADVDCHNIGGLPQFAFGRHPRADRCGHWKDTPATSYSMRPPLALCQPRSWPIICPSKN
ncbi:MAG: hypothetical protein JJE04_13245 [Acidobacteriia bacterium]|nr:hypothetical protein [Terriglobia bacterium]